MKRSGKKAITPAKKTRARAKEASVEVGIRAILVPTDFSHYSEKALEYAIPLARQFGARLTLLHVIEPVATPDFEGAFPLALENARAKELCHSALKALSEKFGNEPALIEGRVVRQGRAFDEIAKAARELKIDLIVIATHGYTGLKHTFLGSTAERVVRHAPCPVLVVR
jgi:universal stress protein A